MKKYIFNRLFTCLATVVICLTGSAPAGIAAAVTAASKAVAYQQKASPWGTYPFNRRDPADLTKETESGSTLGSAGSSLFSAINAVSYKTGSFMQPTELADFAVSGGYRIKGQDDVGTGFFAALCSTRGAAIGLSYDGATNDIRTALSFVRNGDTACCHIKDHWIAVADYNAEKDMYLILDSDSGSETRSAYILSNANAECERSSDGKWTGVAWVKDVFLTNGTYAVISAAELFRYTAVPAADNPIAPYIRPTEPVRRGMSGESVKWLQYCLFVQLGYNDGGYGVDGEFGPATEAAVRAFQTDHKLEVDGVAGEQTRTALIKAVTEHNSAAPSKNDEPYAPYPRPTGLVKRTRKGDDVRWVQYCLFVHLGYNDGGYGVDGSFGGATEAAVRAFQTDHKLEIDGVVGEQTRTALIQAIDELLKKTTTTKPATTTTTTVTSTTKAAATTTTVTSTTKAAATTTTVTSTTKAAATTTTVTSTTKAAATTTTVTSTTKAAATTTTVTTTTKAAATTTTTVTSTAKAATTTAAVITTAQAATTAAAVTTVNVPGTTAPAVTTVPVTTTAPVKQSEFEKGIDVSEAAGEIDWKAVADSGVTFAVIRSAEAADGAALTADKNFAKNYEDAKAAGLRVGTYIFTDANAASEIKTTVDALLQILDGKTFDLPVYLGFHESKAATAPCKEQLTALAAYGCSLLNQAGHQAGVCTDRNRFGDLLDADRLRKEGAEVWLAEWPSESGTADPAAYHYSDRCTAWQYSGKGTVPGISVPVNTDIRYLPEAEAPQSGTEIRRGDAFRDGVVDLKDVLIMRRALTGGWNTEICEENADVNQDGSFDLKDVTVLRRYLTGGWGIELN